MSYPRERPGARPDTGSADGSPSAPQPAPGPGPRPTPQNAAAAKDALRRELLARRSGQSTDEVTAAGEALAAAVHGLPEMTHAHTVALYVQLPGEPPTMPLLARLTARGVRVLLPVVRSDLDLDWAVHSDVPLTAGPLGIPIPPGPILPPTTLHETDLVVVPALAADAGGRRLGRGGGSYDRALARLPADHPVVALIFDDEVRETIPQQGHDRPVSIVVTPRRVLRARSSTT